jgi:hypothetical protein
MKVTEYTGKFNSNSTTYQLNSCHQTLRSDDSGFKATVKYTELEAHDWAYLKYISRLFEKTNLVSLEFKDNNTLIFEIKPHSTTKEAVITYACFCMFRFVLTYSNTFKEWYKLVKKYPKKNKFKLLLWLNQKHLYVLGGTHTHTFDPRSFYTFDSRDIYISTNCKYRIWEFFSFRTLNPNFKVLKTFITKEEKLAELDKMLKKL